VWLDAPLRPANGGQVSGLAISEEEAIRSNKQSAISGQRSAFSEEEAIRSNKQSAISVQPSAKKKPSGATSGQPSAVSSQRSAERKRSCLMLKAKNGQQSAKSSYLLVLSVWQISCRLVMRTV